MVGEIRASSGRNTKTSFCIIDSQSVNNTDTAENKGYDGGKKISGIKRHIAVDIEGLPHAIHVTTANVTDRDGAVTMITEAKDTLSDVMNVLVDGDILVKNFQTKYRYLLVPLLKLQSEVSCINLQSFQSVGLLSVLLLGLRNVEGYGKIVKEKSTPAYKW